MLPHYSQVGSDRYSKRHRLFFDGNSRRIYGGHSSYIALIEANSWSQQYDEHVTGQCRAWQPKDGCKER